MARWDEEPKDRNPAIDVWHHVRIALTFGGALAILWTLSRDPLWVENTYVDGWGVALAAGIGSATGLLPFSVAEIWLMLIVVWTLIAVLKGFGALWRGRTIGSVLLQGLLNVVDVALVLLTWFYLAWGVAYARPAASDRLGLTVIAASTAPDAAEKQALAQQLRVAVARVNASYEEIHGSPDGGEVTTPDKGFDVDAAVERGFDRVGSLLKEPAWFREAHPPAKRPFASVLMSYVGVAGIYVPFTGEATVDAGPPAWSRVFTVAHEKAHQRMIAPENDANFFGFLACVHADEPVVRYGGWQFARSQLFVAFYAIDPEQAKSLNDTLAPGPKRDVAEVSLYWARYEGRLQDFSRAMNDMYLKTHHVEGGVQAYSESVRLLEAWFATDHGRALLAGERPVPVDTDAAK